ncbi:MAG: tetratricopeptide repeat protein [Terracidiphilus sp.]|jgi:tetratricopeptide (TPR) repeat protein
MSRIDERRFLPATAVLAVLVAASQLFLVQCAGASSVSTTPTQQQAAPPPSLPAAQHPAVAATAPETPEEAGDRLLAEKKFQAAIDAYKKAPHDSPTVWNKMGIAYQQMFSSDEAMRCYMTSLKLNPESASVLNNVGTVYASLQDYRGAERFYRKALKLDPKSGPILKNLGTDLLSRRKFREGGEFYAAALAVDPHIFDGAAGLQITDPISLSSRGAMNYYMAKTCVHAGLNDRAIEYLRMALNDGFTSPSKILADSEFANLHTMPAFEQLLVSQRN